MIYRTRVLFEDKEDGPEWVATYALSYSELDDEFEDTDHVEAIFNAEDFETAVKYAQQYLRKKQIDEETADEWSSAVIVSVELR